MSSLLLNNPFISPLPPSPTLQEAAPALGVSPAQQTQATTDGGGATAFSGSGSGSGDSRQGDNLALLKSLRRNLPTRPMEATGSSVVNAQGEEPSPAIYRNTLPEVSMPDPLPTSPFLKRG